jgi:hypothetical protein
VRTLMSEAAWVHYGQIYVQSGEDYPDLAECSGGQSNGLCGAAIGAALAQELVAVIGDGSGVLCDRMSPSAWAGRWLSRGRGRAIRRPPGGPRATGSAWQAASRRPALPRPPRVDAAELAIRPRPLAGSPGGQRVLRALLRDAFCRPDRPVGVGRRALLGTGIAPGTPAAVLSKLNASTRAAHAARVGLASMHQK